MFDKRRCIENIYAIARKKGLRIGDIEEKAGVSKGYLSRINKEDSTSVPGVDLLASIAGQLGVGIDYLVNFPQGTLTPNEEFVFQFIDRLSIETTAGRMDWVAESATALEAVSDVEVDNPLVSIVLDDSEEYTNSHAKHVYTSLIYSGKVMVYDNCYHTKLPDGQTTVYLNAVSYFDDEKDGTHSEWTDRIIEVYIINNGARPVCSTYYLRDELKKAVEDLYTAVSSSPSHIGLEETTRIIMKSFLDSFPPETDDLPF